LNNQFIEDKELTLVAINFTRLSFLPLLYYSSEWESHSTLGVKVNIKRPASLPCTANHTCFIFPSTKMDVCHYVKRALKERSMLGPSNFAACSINPLQLPIDDTAHDVPVAVEDSPNNGLLSITAKSYIKEFAKKDLLIHDLNRKLENSRKLLDIYKKKTSYQVEAVNLSNDTEEPESELDGAIIKTVNEILAQDK